MKLWQQQPLPPPSNYTSELNWCVFDLVIRVCGGDKFCTPRFFSLLLFTLANRCYISRLVINWLLTIIRSGDLAHTLNGVCTRDKRRESNREIMCRNGSESIHHNLWIMKSISNRHIQHMWLLSTLPIKDCVSFFGVCVCALAKTASVKTDRKQTFFTCFQAFEFQTMSLGPAREHCWLWRVGTYSFLCVIGTAVQPHNCRNTQTHREERGMNTTGGV